MDFPAGDEQVVAEFSAQCVSSDDPLYKSKMGHSTIQNRPPNCRFRQAEIPDQIAMHERSPRSRARG
jgi:hypothetical protein